MQPLITQVMVAVKIPQSIKETIMEAMVDFVYRDMRYFMTVESEGFKSAIQVFINAAAKLGRVFVDNLVPCADTVMRHC